MLPHPAVGTQKMSLTDAFYCYCLMQTQPSAAVSYGGTLTKERTAEF
jgi:hypothetical protein